MGVKLASPPTHQHPERTPPRAAPVAVRSSPSCKNLNYHYSRRLTNWAELEVLYELCRGHQLSTTSFFAVAPILHFDITTLRPTKLNRFSTFSLALRPFDLRHTRSDFSNELLDNYLID